MGEQAALQEGLLTALNSLPGYSVPLNNQFAQFRFFGGLPLRESWFEGAVDNVAQETAGGPLDGTQQTGQATAGPHLSPQTQTVGIGACLSTYNAYFKPSLGLWRRDEMASYGPATVATKVTIPWGRLDLLPLQVDWPAPIPFALLPYREPSGWPQTWVGGEPALDPPPLVNGPPMRPRKPPGPKTKERKSKATKALLGVLKVLGDVTEALDLMDAFYAALPKSVRPSLRGLNKAQQEIAKGRILYKNWHLVDLDTALFNAAWNQVSDMVFAQLGLPGGIAKRPYGANVGANKLIGGALGGSTRDLMNRANQQTKDTLNALLGTTIQ